MGLDLLCLLVNHEAFVSVEIDEGLTVGVLRNKIKEAASSTVKCDACMLELYPGKLKKAQPDEYEVLTTTDDGQLQNVWIRGDVDDVTKAKSMDSFNDRMTDEMEMMDDETLEAFFNAPKGVIHVLVKEKRPVAPEPKRQKLNEVEWQEELSSSVHTIDNCDIVSRDDAVTRLHDMTFINARLEELSLVLAAIG